MYHTKARCLYQGKLQGVWDCSVLSLYLLYKSRSALKKNEVTFRIFYISMCMCIYIYTKDMEVFQGIGGRFGHSRLERQGQVSLQHHL